MMFRNKKTFLYGAITIILIASQVAYLVIKSFEQKDRQELTLENNVQKASTSSGKPQEIPSPTVSTITISQPATSSVSVIYEEGLLIDEPLKQEIESKVIKPYIDYYKTSQDRVGLQTLLVQNNTQKDLSNPFTLSSTFENGRNEMIFIKSDNGQIQWWLPDCIYNCPFPPGFKLKYPEIVKFYE
jgi:hypothetical protein